MKAQVVKMTAMAFHKWKAFKILDIRMTAKQNEKISYDSSNTDAMVEAAAAAAEYFRHLMAQISPEGNTLTPGTKIEALIKKATTSNRLSFNKSTSQSC
jgi:hypothetical protein